jgi:uncharacterized protein DUF3800
VLYTIARASAYLGGCVSTNFVYLDEFGHIGPYMGRKATRYNESPVFGLAGIILPETAIRPFATKFLQLKEHLFSKEITRAQTIGALWEKKGTEIFTTKHVAKYKHYRATGFRLINEVRNCGGKIFYYGREKIRGTTNVNSVGLYTTVLSHTIRQLESFSDAHQTNYVMVVDEHSARKQLLVTASKTMFGQPPARHLLSPPFEVESYINQNIQAADWIAAIIGRLWASELRPAEYADHAKFKRYFWLRVHQVATHSTVLPR